MAVRPAIKLTRKQIYDEIWSAAVSGMGLVGLNFFPKKRKEDEE